MTTMVKSIFGAFSAPPDTVLAITIRMGFVGLSIAEDPLSSFSVLLFPLSPPEDSFSSSILLKF